MDIKSYVHVSTSFGHEKKKTRLWVRAEATLNCVNRHHRDMVSNGVFFCKEPRDKNSQGNCNSLDGV